MSMPFFSAILINRCIFREDGLLWFNPGSVFLGRGASRKTIGILRIQDKIEAEILEI